MGFYNHTAGSCSVTVVEEPAQSRRKRFINSCYRHHINEPCRRADWSNRLLRMFRTERRSRCHLVPRQAPRCCKAFLAQQRRYWRRRRWVVTRHARKGTNVFAMNASTITAKESGPLVCTAIGQTRRYPYVQPPKVSSLPCSCAGVSGL